MQNVRSEGGYTLIELVVVMALLIGLTTITVLNGTDSRRLTHLNNAAMQLESMLMQAQAYGHSGQAYPPGDTSPEAFDRGYGIYVRRGGSDIIMYGGWDSDGNGTVDTDEEFYDPAYEVERITLDGGVVVQSTQVTAPPANVTGGVSVHFRRGETGAHINARSPTQYERTQLTVRLAVAGMTKDVIVNKTGLIYIAN